MDTNTIVALIGAAGLVLGGLIAWASKHGGEKLTDEGQFRKDLMERNAKLEQRAGELEGERDDWREKYFKLLAENHSGPTAQTTVVVQQPPAIGGS